MKYFIVAALFITVILSACQNQHKTEMRENPFFIAWNTPFEVPPFDLIGIDDYVPAYEEGMKLHNLEIDNIINSTEPADFENTIVALDQSGGLLTRVDNIFGNLNSANTNPEMQQIAKDMAPLLSAHYDNIRLNVPLFEKVKTVYNQQDNLDLTDEDKMLLKKTYDRFIRGGANLPENQKERFREINGQLSLLSIQFRENQLAETNSFQLVITDENDLSGLPQSVKDAAAETALEKNMNGGWVFTLQKPSLIPFITYADNRDLRKYLFEGYVNRGSLENEFDNCEILNEMVNLRLERAQMLGYKNHAEYVLDINMAKTAENVYDLIGDLMEAALPVAKKEAKVLQQMIDEEDGGFNLEPWDWWYYAEKIKKQNYDFDDEVLRPYFKLENVKEGVFDVASKLYGLRFVERNDIPVYHPDAVAYEVQSEDGETIGVLYMDFYPRESKRSGAWMTSFRKQSKKDGINIIPQIQVVCNFSKPTVDKPALLSFDEASTLFHEFGHALHGLLSDCNYTTLSGTSVPRDFVELPSQVMENWASHPDVLANYARHYQTDEPIPADLLAKMENAQHFNQGFTVVEFMSAALLDMDWHTITEKNDMEVMDFENASLEKMGMIPEIVVRYRSPYFAHIFAGGYSAGYYSYAWAEVLDADAFEAFKENGIFDQKTARAFRDNILSKGGTEDPMKMYVQFRGRKPTTDAMLERKGLK